MNSAEKIETIRKKGHISSTMEGNFQHLTGWNLREIATCQISLILKWHLAVIAYLAIILLIGVATRNWIPIGMAAVSGGLCSLIARYGIHQRLYHRALRHLANSLPDPEEMMEGLIFDYSVEELTRIIGPNILLKIRKNRARFTSVATA